MTATQAKPVRWGHRTFLSEQHRAMVLNICTAVSKRRDLYLQSLPLDRRCYLCSQEIGPDESGVHRSKDGTVTHYTCADRASKD